MLLEDAFADGSAGVARRFPATVTRRDGDPTFVELIDEAGGLFWQYLKSPFSLDLTPEHYASLLEKGTIKAARNFDQLWAQRRAPIGADSLLGRILGYRTSPKTQLQLPILRGGCHLAGNLGR
jgi:hypothetical protein